MMDELLIQLGGIYTIGLIVFHVSFWRLFEWPASLQSLNLINKATMQVLNISITLIFCIFAYISFAHTAELLNTSLGNTLLVLISWLWLIRAVLQVAFYKLKHSASVALTLYFLLGAALYGLPVVISQSIINRRRDLQQCRSPGLGVESGICFHSELDNDVPVPRVEYCSGISYCR